MRRGWIEHHRSLTARSGEEAERLVRAGGGAQINIKQPDHRLTYGGSEGSRRSSATNTGDNDDRPTSASSAGSYWHRQTLRDLHSNAINCDADIGRGHLRKHREVSIGIHIPDT